MIRSMAAADSVLHRVAEQQSAASAQQALVDLAPCVVMYVLPRLPSVCFLTCLKERDCLGCVPLAKLAPCSRFLFFLEKLSYSLFMKPEDLLP